MLTAAFPLSKSNELIEHEAHEELMSDFCSLKPQLMLLRTTFVESFRACGNPLNLE